VWGFKLKEGLMLSKPAFYHLSHSTSPESIVLISKNKNNFQVVHEEYSQGKWSVKVYQESRMNGEKYD
jgi:hypothetical protein